MLKELNEFAAGYRLRNVKTFDTGRGLAWSASLYRYGKKIGAVNDDGNGGQLRIQVPKAEYETLVQVGNNIKSPSQFEPAEFFLSMLFEYSDVVTRLKRMDKKQPIALHSGSFDEQGLPQEYSQFRLANTPQNLEAIRERNPGVRLFADEIALWENPGQAPVAAHTEMAPRPATRAPRPS